MKFNVHLGTAAASLLLVILVITAELFSPFKELLKTAFTHHWLAKAILILLAFLITGFTLKNKHTLFKIKEEKLSWYSTLLSILIIFLFYNVEYFT